MGYTTYDGAFVDYDDPEPPVVRFVCHAENLAYYPEDDGWLCPECGEDGELEHVTYEGQKDGSVVALSQNWLGEYHHYHGEGSTPQEAIRALYEAIKKDLVG